MQEALAIGAFALVLTGIAACIVIGRNRWSLVKEGKCLSISHRDWTRFTGVCPYTYDDLYCDETDTHIRFEDGQETLGCQELHYGGALPARLRLEVNWFGKHRLVPATPASDQAA